MKQLISDLLRSRAGAAWWWLVLVPVAWCTLFWHLGERPLQYWDESRLAVNAAEMLRTHRWLVTLYQGQPDLWNTKPPLLIWLQALSLHTLGYSIWAFRLPTALASLALTGLVATFARRWLGGPLAGVLAGLALLSNNGFITFHVSRSGDYDALLLLFTTAQVLAAFAWLQTRRGGYLLVLGAAIGLAVLTKSVAGLFMLPGVAFEIARRGRLTSLLRQPAAWGAAGLALGLPALWFGWREYAAPGYWHAVWQNDLGGRLLTTLDGNGGPWYLYLVSFVSPPMRYWMLWVLVAGGALARRPSQRSAHRFLSLAFWSAAGLLAIISLAKTKLLWYNAPIYPLLALVLGGGLTALVQQVQVSAGREAANWGSMLLAALVLGPSFIALRRGLAEESAWQRDPYGPFLRAPAATAAAGTHFTALHYGFSLDTLNYNPPLEFHALAFQHDHPGTTVEVRYDVAQLPAGRVVLVCGAAGQALLTKHYRTRLLYAADSCLTLQVLGLWPSAVAK